MPLNEFELITTYFKRQARHQSVVKGVGDDCAIVTVNAGMDLVMSMDTLVSGRHFPEHSSPEDIATRCFATCLSDLAAMGARPLWFTLALTLPSADRHWLSLFSQSLFAIADEYHCDLIGGDTTQGPLTISIQVHGELASGSALQRDGAKEGDHIFVTGNVGDGAAALSMLMNSKKKFKLDKTDENYLQTHFYRPVVQIDAGIKIVGFANSAIDVSDGLLADLQHIAEASSVDMEIDLNLLPISDTCRRVAIDTESALNFALCGGDDYQLAFTVPRHHLSEVTELIESKKINATEIGKVLKSISSEPSIRCYQDKKQVTLAHNNKGYQHFAS